MQQATQRKRTRGGWSEAESSLLWETADEAQQSGRPLKQVFVQVAEKTGRKPNSVRNFYYALAHQRADAQKPPSRFVPFSQEEVEQLMRGVLRARAQGQSVRACVTEMAQGDHRAMLRFQNKYRSTLVARPDMVERIVAELRNSGVDMDIPTITPRGPRAGEDAPERLRLAAQRSGDEDIAHMVDVILRLIKGVSGSDRARQTELATERDRAQVRADILRLALSERQARFDRLGGCCVRILDSLKEYLAMDAARQREGWNAFCEGMLDYTSELENVIGEPVGMAESHALRA